VNAREEPRIETSYDHRHTAFEVVEFCIYVYAIYSVVKESQIWALGINSYAATYLFVVLTFLAVITRNYIVMQSIDRNENTDSESYRFVEVQRGIWIAIERTIRVALISVVVMAPKSFPFLVHPMGYVGWFLEHIVLNVCEFANISPEHLKSAQLSSLHDTLLYYAAVLFSIAFLSVLWDLVAVASFRLGTTAGPSPVRLCASPDVQIADRHIGNDVYRSILLYTNSFKVRDDEERFSIPRWKWFKKRLEAGHAGFVYLFSWKLAERLTLMLFALLMVAAAMTDMSGPTDVLLGMNLMGYLYMAGHNQRYWRDSFGMFGYPLFYWIRKQSVQTALLHYDDPATETGAS